MSRFASSGKAYSFHCKEYIFCGIPYWRMSWVIDYYGDRLRYPRLFTRDTEDRKAAMGFCKRHNLEMH